MGRVLGLLIIGCVLPALAAACGPNCGMKMNSAGLAMLESFEGYVNHCYNDPVGNPTCCYGHLGCPGGSGPFAQSYCQSLLQQDLSSFETCVANAVTVQLTSNQFSALVDFAYNLGCGALQDSTLLAKLNSGDFQICSYMEEYVYASGKKLPGLVRRRQAECNLFSNGNPGVDTSPPARTGGTAGSTSGTCACASLANCQKYGGGNACFAQQGCSTLGTCVENGGGNACYLNAGCNTVSTTSGCDCRGLQTCLANCGGNACFSKFDCPQIENCVQYDGGLACFSKFGCTNLQYTKTCGTVSDVSRSGSGTVVTNTEAESMDSSSKNIYVGIGCAFGGLVMGVAILQYITNKRKQRQQVLLSTL